jgi:TPR repeat protein
VVRHAREITLTLSAAVAVSLVLGFVLGVYNEPIRDAIKDVALRLRGSENTEAGYVAFQKGRYREALRRLRPLAELGDARAQSTLGFIFSHGDGVPTDAAEALKWLRLAANQGDAPAQHQLGLMYSNGQGVPQDHVEAAKWHQRAADRGYPQAQYELGFRYAFGDGVARDYVRAHMWLNLAIAQLPSSDARRRRAAILNREVLEGRMTREQVLEAQRLAREWKRSEP